MLQIQLLARTALDKEFQPMVPWTEDTDIVSRTLAAMFVVWASANYPGQTPTQAQADEFKQLVKLQQKKDGVVSDTEVEIGAVTPEQLAEMRGPRTLN